MTLNDIYLLSPELSIAILAGLLLVVDLCFHRKIHIAPIAIVGLAIPLGLSILLWLDLDPTTRTLTNDGILAKTFTVDRFSLFFKLLLIGTVATVILISRDHARRFRSFEAEFYSLLLFSTSGMMLLSSSIELVTIYVSLELTALPVAALVAFSRDGRSSEASLKFLVLSGISSALLLYGMVLVYGLTGSTVLSEISVRLSTIGFNTTFPTGSYALLLGIILLIAGFGFKITAFPFQMWAPDVYEGAPTPITTFLSVASKAAGFAVILRVLYTAFDFPDVAVEWSYIFAILAALSMTIGNIIAIAQRNIKRMLAYSTIAHAGYIMVGVAAYPAVHQSGLGEDGGASGVLFYLAAYALGNLVAFSAIIGASSHLGNDRIDSYAGMARRAPLIGVPLALSMISLTGLPPTAGFMAKIYIFGAAVDNGLAWLAIIGVLNSVLSAFYYFRIIKIMVLAPPLQNTPIRLERLVLFALMVTTIGVLLFGIYPTPLIELAKSAVSSFL